jgi:hypothetical protein
MPSRKQEKRRTRREQKGGQLGYDRPEAASESPSRDA